MGVSETAPAVLTVEQLADLAKMAAKAEEPGEPLPVAAQELSQLLETARAYHRLTSALEFLYDRGSCVNIIDGRVGSLHPQRVLDTARSLGWKDPQ
jgi:hypothetical protein